MKDSFESVITAALADRWESLPLLGSWAGVEGWDHTLGRIDPEAVAERVKNKKSLLLRLGKIRPPGGPEEELDHKVLSGSLAVQIPEIERYRRLEWDAALCPLTVVRSLHILITRPLPSAYRRDAIRPAWPRLRVIFVRAWTTCAAPIPRRSGWPRMPAPPG